MFGNYIEKEKVYKRLVIWRILNAFILLACVLFIDFVFASVYPTVDMFYSSYGLEMSFISTMLPKLMVIMTVISIVYVSLLIIKLPRKVEVEEKLAKYSEEKVNIKKLNNGFYDYIGYIIIIIMTALIVFGAIIPAKVQVS